MFQNSTHASTYPNTHNVHVTSSCGVFLSVQNFLFIWPFCITCIGVHMVECSWVKGLFLPRSIPVVLPPSNFLIGETPANKIKKAPIAKQPQTWFFKSYKFLSNYKKVQCMMDVRFYTTPPPPSLQCQPKLWAAPW